MKKIIALLAAGAALTGMQASAAIALTFTSGAGIILQADGTTLLPASQAFAVYWSDDAVISFNNANYQAPGGDDVFLGVFNTSGGVAAVGRITGNANVPFASAPGANSIYIVVFQTAYNGGGSAIGDGTKYGVGPVFTGLTDASTLPPPNADNYGITMTANHITLNQTMVPEPASFAFFGLGVLVFAIRRFRRS